MGTKIRRVEGILSAPLDRTLLMMSLERGLYYEAAGAGARIWDLLAEPIAEEAIVAALLDAFAVEPEVCAAEVATFLRDLRENGLTVEVEAR